MSNNNGLHMMLLCDFYKISHRSQYPAGTEYIYSTWTPRTSRIKNVDAVVAFGFKAFIQKYLVDMFNENFFDVEKDVVVKEYKRIIKHTLGVDNPDTKHIEDLHDLGYLPLVVKALPEGTLTPIRVPMMTIYNTDSRFFWLTNYIETLASCELWQASTSATLALQYKKLLMKYAEETGGSKEFVQFQGHDFSMRGMSSLDSSMSSGAGHLLSFVGSDTIPAIMYLEKYYGANVEKELVGCSVNACYDDKTQILTEHGWKLFRNLLIDEKVAQYNLDGTIEFVLPIKYHEYKYEGEMISYGKNKGYKYVDMMVTPNHRMVRYNVQRGLEFFEAGDLSYENRIGFSQSNNLIVSGKIKNIGKRLSVLDKLKIAFQADGSFPSHHEDYNGSRGSLYPIRFSLKKERKKQRLCEILEEGNIKYTITKYENGYYSFWINSPVEMVKDFKWINLSEISYEWANEFIEELQYWDGHHGKNTISYSSIKKECIDMIQAIACLCEKKVQISSHKDSRNNYIRKEIHRCVILKNKTRITGIGVSKTLSNYNGNVYCVSVPSKMILVRRNNVVSVCGNSEHSIQCTYNNDMKYFRTLINDVHPKGIVSIVSDGYDFWNVVDNVLPALKNDIMQRDGKTVVRPDCYDEETKVLTDNGWKYFKDLDKENDLIAQVKEDLTYEFVKPLKYTQQEYSGDMYKFKDQKGKLDLLVTPNHRMFFNINGKNIVQDAENSKVGDWLKRMYRSAASVNKNRTLSSLERLKIAFQADGSFTTSGDKIRFSFKKERKIKRLQNILNDLKVGFKSYDLKDGKVEINVDVNSFEFQKDFEWVNTSDLCSNWSKEFIEELSYWDATRRTPERFKFDTTVKIVMDKVELIALSAGFGIYVVESEDTRKDCFSNIFTAHIMKDNLLGGQSMSKEKVQYNGKIYCVTVPSGLILVKRNKSVVVCGNSGDPADILCGTVRPFIVEHSKDIHIIEYKPNRTSEEKGLVECLWDTFGGTVNAEGYKELDSHIGCIYGDAITLERCEDICQRLKDKGFASTNVVYGIGSFTYQFNTRDTFGFALKSTLAVINGQNVHIFKDPKTDIGSIKKSAKGGVVVEKDANGKLMVRDGLDLNETFGGELEYVFINGYVPKSTHNTLKDIRERLCKQ